MRSIWLSFFIFFCFWTLTAQEGNPLLVIKKIAVAKTLQVDSLSIQPFSFKLLDKHKQAIDSSQYSIDFSSAILKLTPKLILENDSIEVHYLKYPEFITKNLYEQSENHFSKQYRYTKASSIRNSKYRQQVYPL